MKVQRDVQRDLATHCGALRVKQSRVNAILQECNHAIIKHASSHSVQQTNRIEQIGVVTRAHFCGVLEHLLVVHLELLSSAGNKRKWDVGRKEGREEGREGGGTERESVTQAYRKGKVH